MVVSKVVELKVHGDSIFQDAPKAENSPNELNSLAFGAFG